MPLPHFLSDPSQPGWLEDVKAVTGQEIKFPIIADPKREIATKLGMLDNTESGGELPMTVRNVFYINPDRKLKALIICKCSASFVYLLEPTSLIVLFIAPALRPSRCWTEQCRAAPCAEGSVHYRFRSAGKRILRFTTIPGVPLKQRTYFPFSSPGDSCELGARTRSHGAPCAEHGGGKDALRGLPFQGCSVWQGLHALRA